MMKFILKVLPLLIVGIVSLILQRFLLLPLLIGVILSLLLCFWCFLFKPLFRLRKHFTVSIWEKVIPDIQKATNTITMLSSAAIILTFTILQVLAKEFSYKNILVFSWYGFGLSVLVGVIIVVLIYILRAYYLTMIKKFHDLENVDEEDKKEIKKQGGIATDFLRRANRFGKILLFLALTQPFVFFGSMVLVILFVVKNI